jgi:hypothetical protein
MAKVSGVRLRLTPLFTAMLLCPVSRLLKAMCRETREEEQAAAGYGAEGRKKCKGKLNKRGAVKDRRQYRARYSRITAGSKFPPSSPPVSTLSAGPLRRIV